MSTLILELISFLCMFMITIFLFRIFWCRTYTKEIKIFINRPLSSALQNKNITINFFRIQAYYSIMCGYFCIAFINFMLAGTTLTEFTNLFSPDNLKNIYIYIYIYNFKVFYDQCVKMVECNSHNMYPNVRTNTLNEQQFRLNKINKSKDYFSLDYSLD